MNTSKLFFISIALLISNYIFSQYNYIPLLDAKSNPSNLNTENDITDPLNGNGWKSIYNLSTTNNVWSQVQTLPFDFNFNNIVVRDFKVSNSGVLTFSTSTITVPSNNNIKLPSPTIPNNSICILGIQGIKNFASIVYPSNARTPMIRTKVFGNSPARQFWISFSAFSAMIQDSSKCILSNWSIVLEESTNKIYIIDHCTFPYVLATGGFRPDTTINAKLSIGIQIDANLAYTIPSSPNTSSTVVNPRIGVNLNYTAYDNAYHIFTLDQSQTDYDLSVSQIDLKQYTRGKATGIPISGKIINYGKKNINSFRLRLEDDHGFYADSIISGIMIIPTAEYTFTSPSWAPKSSDEIKIKIWCDKLNGDKVDQFSFNDTASKTTSYMINPPVKKVILEEFTGTWCGHCPRSASAFDYCLEHVPNSIGLAYHVANDPMTTPFTSNIAIAYASGYPNGMIDRKTFSEFGEFRPVLSVEKTDDYLHGAPYLRRMNINRDEACPMHIDLDHLFNPLTRQLDVTVRTKFEAITKGDLRINVILTEDSITGGNEYDQINYMAGDTSYAYWSTQPSRIKNFVHNHVVRFNMADSLHDFGTNNVIPKIANIGDSYSKTYSTIIPSKWNINQLNIIAFIMDYNDDKARAFIWNANETKVTNFLSTTSDNSSDLDNIILVPNPASDKLIISFPKNYIPSDNIALEVFTQGSLRLKTDITQISNHQYDVNIDHLNSGIYFLKISNSKKSETIKFIILK